MKKICIILLMCIGASFAYSITLNTDSLSDYISEEDCLLLESWA